MSIRIKRNIEPNPTAPTSIAAVPSIVERIDAVRSSACPPVAVFCLYKILK